MYVPNRSRRYEEERPPAAGQTQNTHTMGLPSSEYGVCVSGARLSPWEFVPTNKMILSLVDWRGSNSPPGMPMERRPSAHKDPEWSVMSRQAHLKSDPSEACIITQQPDQLWKEGER